MNINSHILKLQGKAELPEEIETGDNYHVALSGGIEKLEFHDNHDGTWDKIYTLKPIKIELLNHLGKSLKLKDPRKNSQKIRGALWKHYFQEGYTGDFDALYDAFTYEVIGLMPQLIRGAVKRVNDV